MKLGKARLTVVSAAQANAFCKTVLDAYTAQIQVPQQATTPSKGQFTAKLLQMAMMLCMRMQLHLCNTDTWSGKASVHTRKTASTLLKACFSSGGPASLLFGSGTKLLHRASAFRRLLPQPMASVFTPVSLPSSHATMPSNCPYLNEELQSKLLQSCVQCMSLMADGHLSSIPVWPCDIQKMTKLT